MPSASRQSLLATACLATVNIGLDRHVRAHGRIGNRLDELYEESLGLPPPGRTCVLGAAARFQLE